MTMKTLKFTFTRDQVTLIPNFSTYGPYTDGRSYHKSNFKVNGTDIIADMDIVNGKEGPIKIVCAASSPAAQRLISMGLVND